MFSKLFTVWMLAGVAGAFGQSLPAVSGDRIKAHVKFLSSDQLEGRGVGTRGGQLAEEYIAAQLKAAGAMPGGENGTYYQRVPLIGVKTLPGSELTATKNGQTLNFRWEEDYVGASHRQKAEDAFTGELVFVGHGISAPQQKWNDYKTSVKGKLIVLFTNEPQPQNPKIFQGRTLTYFGRWTYKFEEALRQGALGAIIIHTDETAGYGWEVVRNSWGKEDPQVKLEPGAEALSFAGWLTRAAGGKLLAMAGKSVDELLKEADKPEFKPIPLGITISGKLKAEVRPIETRNVAGRIDGSDPALKSQAVVFSAHWDHLGISVPVNGDSIYNGAVDNATGCGIVIELARAWAQLNPKPRRSALFLFVTAEEGGLRGSQYYAQHPMVAPGLTAININYDAIYPASRRDSIVVTGAERTTLWPLVQRIAKAQLFKIEPDPRPEQGSYYRSDHFMMARAGIPAFSLRMGGTYPDYSRDYHQPSDHFRENWDFATLEQAANLGLLIAREVANQPKLATWKRGDEFLPARQASFRRGS